MQAERDYLRSHVFPRLEEKLRERRRYFEPIDLRMGVETARLGTVEERELSVLKVCLQEIERSRPYFLAMLGDRFGWVPPPERMATAVQEVGFDTAVQGKSVTALEIEFGLLAKHPDQHRRCFFYFRDPLPYARMPPEIAARYTDQFSTDPQTRAGYDRLRDLKDQLRSDRELGPQVHRYVASWDEAAQRLTGLEAFGEMVFNHLWAQLEAETCDFAGQAPTTWQQQEQAAFQEFVAQRSRDFTGRGELLDQLFGVARSPSADGVPWGACVTGAAGSGKSALLAELYQRLAADDSLLILANAAGATPRGAEPDAVLRRFIGELAGALRIPDPLPENAGLEGLDATFASLLARAAQRGRVVVLLDALDQFDATPRGRHLIWLRATPWPSNARLIVTTLPGSSQMLAVSQWAGVAELALPPLTTPDVQEIARRVWARYHRQVNFEVLRVLEQKKLPDGRSAAGNPLWLTLALEQINLLGADDFARAEREFTHDPAGRLQALLIDTVSRMPPDVPALYGWLLAQTEKSFGAPHARAFALLIAVSRLGWRESDLRALIPIIARLLFPQQIISEIDDLGLASLRRGFRAHLVRRGAGGPLDFVHAQMRPAVQARVRTDEAILQAVHRAIAVHLETLSPNDPLRESELMVHLIAGDEPQRAALVYGDPALSPSATTGATQAFVRHILLGPVQLPSANSDWVVTLPSQPNLLPVHAARIANRFNFDLHDALAHHAPIAIQERVLASAASTLERLTATDSANYAWQYDRMVSVAKLGDLAMTQGNLAGASRAFSKAKTIAEWLAAGNPAKAGCQCDLALALDKLGNVAVAQGDLAGALRAFSESKVIRERVAASDPTNPWWQRDLSVSLQKLGDLAWARGDLTGAVRHFNADKTIVERLAASDPANAGCQHDLSTSLQKLGDLAVAQGDLAGAFRAFSESRPIVERLAASDPANAGWQRDLSLSREKLGDLAVAQGDLAGAWRAFSEGRTIVERLAASDPANTVWQRDLSVLLNKLGDLAAAQGDQAGALRAFSESKLIRERLAASDPANSVWQRDLSVLLNKLGDVAVARGDLAGALRAFSEGRTIIERLAANDPSNAEWQLGLCASLQRCAIVASRSGETGAASDYYGRCHFALKAMLARRMHLNSSLTDWFTQLERYAPENYETLVAAYSNPSGTAYPRPPTHPIAPNPPPVPHWKNSTEDLRESAQFNFGKRYWEAAAMDFQKLLERGDPLEDLAPNIVTCLLNAHETLMPHHAAAIDDLLRRLTDAGHATLAANLRRQLEAKIPKPQKPWWKIW